MGSKSLLGSVFVSAASSHRMLLSELASHGHSASLWRASWARASVTAPRIPVAWAAQVLPNAVWIKAEQRAALPKAVMSHVCAQLSAVKGPTRVHFVNSRTAIRSGPFMLSILKASAGLPLTLHGRLRADETLVQIGQVDDCGAIVSIASADCETREFALSPFPGGQALLAPAARLRGDLVATAATNKLLLAELHLGQRIGAGDRVLDLGCAPGAWSAVALERGAVVDGVDRGVPELAHERFTFHRCDAKSFAVESGRFDWLLCDVVESVEQIQEIVERWLAPSAKIVAPGGRPLHFVVTVKFRDPVAEAHQLVTLIRRAVGWCSDNGRVRGRVGVRHIAAANTGNEVMLFGTIEADGAKSPNKETLR
jgi:SAM-dependent methyltransferase